MLAFSPLIGGFMYFVPDSPYIEAFLHLSFCVMVSEIPKNSITIAPGSHLCWTASWTAAAERVVPQKLIPGVLPHIKLNFVDTGKV